MTTIAILRPRLTRLRARVSNVGFAAALLACCSLFHLAACGEERTELTGNALQEQYFGLATEDLQTERVRLKHWLDNQADEEKYPDLVARSRESLRMIDEELARRGETPLDADITEVEVDLQSDN